MQLTAGGQAPSHGRVGIATPHAAATAAAGDAIRAGGSAIDAALAAAATLTVVYPHNTGIGGDLIALVQTPDGTVRCLNATGPAAARVDPERLRQRYGGRMPITGPDTVTVPGAVGGWWRLHQLGGRLTWAAAFERAIAYAGDGTTVSRSVAGAFAELASAPDIDAGMAQVFLRDGTPPGEGELLAQPALAATLRRIADEGPEALYGGAIGAQVTQTLERLGSTMRIDDLAGYTVEEPVPLQRHLLGQTVWTAPPNSQGFALLQTLGALEYLADGPRAALTSCPATVAGLFYQANRDRDAFLADPRLAAVDIEALLAPERLSELARRVQRGPCLGPSATAPYPDGDTVAVSVIDTDGYAVSLIQSLFHSFGAAVCDPATGVVLHNRGAFFSLDPDSPNVIQPGKRPAHTLMPVLVTQGDRPRVAAGTMGGKGQPQILAQVLLRAMTGDPLDVAMSAPRWVVGGLEVGQAEQTVHVEAPVERQVRDQLSASGWPLRELPEHSEETGHAQFVALDVTGQLSVASDPRSDGAALVVDR